MVEYKTYTCVKCGKKFTKSVGGVVASPREMELFIHLPAMEEEIV